MPTAAEYREQLKQLLPPGQAFPREPGTTLHNLLDGMSVELARVDERGFTLPLEANPATTTELLSDWERVAGLPDRCSGALEETIQGRRNALLAKLASTGGQSPAYFISIAAALGYEVSITEFRPFRVGMSEMGDALTNGDWQFTWQVSGPETTVLTFRVGLSAVGEPLRSWGTSSLECKIRQLAPAHTIPIFAYANSSLDLNFALDTYLVSQKSVLLASIMSFTRASSAYRLNSSKLLEQVASGVARINYSSSTGAREGLLIETAASNSILRSQEFENAAWSKTRATVIANAVLAPDGNLTADKLVVDSTPSSTHRVFQSTTLSAAIGDSVTVSIFLKAAEIPYVYLQITGGAGTPFAANVGRYFDVLNGIAGFGSALSTYVITPYPDGWFRISYTMTATQAGTVSFEIYSAYALASGSVTGNGDGVSGFYMWGAQVEINDYPSTYIQTTTAVANRNADVPVTEMVSPGLGLSAGTFVIDFRTDAPLSNAAATRRHLFTLRTGNEQLIVYLQTGGVGTVTRTTAGGIVTQGVFGGNITDGKVAIAFDGTNLTTAVAGAVRTVPATLNVAAMTTLSIGTQGTDNTRQLNGVVRSLRYYPRRVSDADLIALTLP